MKWKTKPGCGFREKCIFDNTLSYGKFRICILDKEHSYSASQVRSFGRERKIHPEMQRTASLTRSVCIIPWATSTCPWPCQPKHLYRRIFIRPFRPFLDIVYGDLCIAFFISELSGRVRKFSTRKSECNTIGTG